MWQCKIANSLGGGFAGTPNQVWGTGDYVNNTDPTVFFGCYGLPDFYAIWRHKGRKAILWAGSDIRHLLNGYWLEDGGAIRLPPKEMAKWLNKNCENYCENIVEWKALKGLGIDSTIIPSFLGNVNDYQVEYKWSDTPKVYASVSGDDFKLYKWDVIDLLAREHRGIEFHLYGNKTPWATGEKNVIVHGRVPQEVMNAEIKQMQAGLRLLDFDGFSEITAKSFLWGQWPITTIPYPHALTLSDLGSLKDKKEPNLEGRNYYLNTLNKYPWTS